MYLPNCDKKLLESMKKAQESECDYVLLLDDQTLVHCSGFYSTNVNDALRSPHRFSAGFDSGALLDRSLQYLIDAGLVAHAPASASVYQVTHLGWYNKTIHRTEICNMILTHVAFPSLVALLTTLVTEFIARLL